MCRNGTELACSARIVYVAVATDGSGKREIAPELATALGAPAPLELGGIAQEKPRLADKVERNIGKPEVLFERRGMSYPLRQALSEDETRVGEP